MSLKIHICNNDADANLVIETEKINSKNPNLTAEKLTMPDIVIRDHSVAVDAPKLLSQGKVCVVFHDT